MTQSRYTRFRKTPDDFTVNVVGYNTHTPTGTVTNFTRSGVNQCLGHHSMFDVSGDYPSRDRRRWNVHPCSHTVFELGTSAYFPRVHSTGDNNVQTYVTPSYIMSPISTTDLEAICPPVPISVLHPFALEAFNYFSTIWPEDLSLAEFVQGLVELKALLPSVQETMTKTLSGGFLNYKFGWESLLGDLNSINSMFTTVRERIEYLKRTNGVPTRLGFHRNSIWVPSTLNVPTFGTSGWDTIKTRHTLIESRSDFQATCTIVNTLDFLDGVVGWIRALSGALGLNNPVKAFWNVIPFSFVVDWFIKVDKRLDNLTRINPAVGWSILNATCSVKTSYRVKTEFSTLYNGSYWVYVNPGYYTGTRYVRFVGLPVKVDDITPVSDLTPEQLVLFLALLNQQG
jgi:hypothetical protein